MFTSLKFYAASQFVNFITTLFFGFFVLSKNRRLAVNRQCGYFCFSVSAWSILYFFWLSTSNGALANFFVRTCMIAAVFIAPSFLHFCALLTKIRLHSLFYRIDYLLGCFLSLFVYTPLFGGRPERFLIFPYWPKAALLFHFVTAYFVINVIIACLLLTKEYFINTDKIIRSRIFIVLLGTIFAFLGGSVNFLLWYRIPILPVTTVLCSLWVLFSIYAIVRYRFLEIDTVIHRTFLWILASTLIFVPIGLSLYFIRPWLFNLNWIQLTFLITVLVYGYLYLYPMVQPRIDHLFRRRKYDYYRVLSEIGEKIGSELDINNVISRLFRELKEVLYIRNGLVLVQQLGREDYTEAGNIGYDKLQDLSKDGQRLILYKSNLSQWLNEHKKALEREQVEADPRYESIKEEASNWLNQNMIEVLIPVVMEDKVNGLVGIGKKENLQAYTAKDIQLLEKMGRQLGVTIDNALHHEDIVEKERLDEELRLGREIQMNLLPHQIPQVPNLSLQGFMTPAKEIGGDYYDFVTLPNKEELAIVIGDVSGKGVAAGLLMSMVKATIHAFSQEGLSPKQILLRTNAFLHQNIGGQKFMTLLYLKWHTQSRIFVYSSAGHEHIIIYRYSGEDRVVRGEGKEEKADTAKEAPYAVGGTPYEHIESILSGGFMLGMMPNIETFLHEKEIKLNIGDKILLYTDGVTEAENQQGERFGLDRLEESFQRHSHKPAQELMQAIKDEVYAFIGNYPQYDDITLVVMEAK